MCGIIGYKGFRDANDVVVKGLKRLEYRGYDSWGIASLNEKINLIKETGKIKDISLESLGLHKTNQAIGHTRWATTGKVSKENAHPHLSSDKRFAIVHNGIVENFQKLKKGLIEKGYSFRSETDTEAIAYIIEEQLKKDELETAFINAFKMLEGRNAVVLIDSKTKKIFGVRKGSPLIIGIGKDEMFLASDAAPLIEYTKKVVFLEDNDMAVLNNNYKIINIKENKEKTADITEIDWDIKQAQKGEYPHFMLKEIMEQRYTIKDAIAVEKEKVMETADAINRAFGSYAVGCGTAGKVCLAATYFFSRITNKHINFSLGSEFAGYHHFLTDKSLLIAISQSGETADTLEATEVAKKKGCNIISLVNVMGSSLMRQSDYVLLNNAGPEKSVCSTKATTAQLAQCILLAYACAGKYKQGIDFLKEASEKIKEMLDNKNCRRIKDLAKKLCKMESIYIIGKGVNYPMALEAAIKIQEVSYIHAEGFAAGELKHGPIALIGKGTPCIALVANDDVKKDALDNAMEVKSRGGFIIGIAPEDNEVFDFWIKAPDIGDASPIANIIPVQLLAYYLAVEKRIDPDFPRNLAKSVTVK